MSFTIETPSIKIKYLNTITTGFTSTFVRTKVGLNIWKSCLTQKQKKKGKEKTDFHSSIIRFATKVTMGHTKYERTRNHTHILFRQRYIHARKGNSHNPRRFVSPDGIFTSSQKKNIRKGQHNRRWMIKSNCALDKNDELQKFCSIYFLKTAAFQAFSCEKKFQLIKTTSRCFHLTWKRSPRSTQTLQASFGSKEVTRKTKPLLWVFDI